MQVAPEQRRLKKHGEKVSGLEYRVFVNQKSGRKNCEIKKSDWKQTKKT